MHYCTLISVALTACAESGTKQANRPIMFDQVISSQGITNVNSLQTSGVFRCQQEGLYLVVFTASSQTKDPDFRIYKNNQFLLEGYTTDRDYDGKYSSGSASVVVELTTNDEITVKPDTDANVFGGSKFWNTCITIARLK